MKIAIIGTGYVGLVTGACFASVGNIVHCVDVNHKVIEQLRSGHVHIYEPQLEEIVMSNIKEGRLFFTTELQDIVNEVDCIFICVGTPTGDDGSCNLTYVYDVAHSIGQHLARDSIIIVKSTVPVGTTEHVQKIIKDLLQERSVSYRIECCSNPEFLKEGSAVEDFKKPDRIIVGINSKDCKSFFESLYAPFSRSKNKLLFMSIASAEMSKYAANAMLATKISFINEMAQLCEKNGADIAQVRIGIGSDTRIGYHFIYPGLGYGGSCFPKDVKALIHQGQSYNLDMEMLQATEAVNTRQKYSLFRMMGAFFSQKGGLQGKTIALWGVAFKPNTDDIREAPAIYTIEQCLHHGMRVHAYDPVAMEHAQCYFSEKDSELYFMQDMYSVLKGADILCIATEWALFQQPDFSRIVQELRYPCIIDGRNIYSYEMLQSFGINYICIGNATQAGSIL